MSNAVGGSELNTQRVRSPWLNPPIVWIVAGCFFLTPLMIPSEHVQLRALACVLVVELFFKTIDFARHRSSPKNLSPQSLKTLVRFLVPFPVMLVRFDRIPNQTQPDISKLTPTLGALAVFGLCFGALRVSANFDWVQSNFLVDHTLKFVIFTVAIESLARTLYGVEQMAGYKTQPLINAAYRSRTVGEFWVRYNTRVHGWFQSNVFQPLVGMKYGWGVAILGTFFVSAALHEVGFAVATSRVDGYQFVFFMLQAPAVMTWRAFHMALHKHAVGRLVLHASTILWMWATSMLFFHGVDRVFPFFYAATPWLP